ncbi:MULTISPECIES: ester cyclase [unclassified Streptomyces]|uniref:ester cyclase n=1 Tax=unclassified Streptomyces TaxID=2593676 RepID=UPI0004BFBABC|nr:MULTISPECIES: ester cyclase [unclassified Streptomyces]KOV95245.1 SnoaL-like polyketide cyclase [Streptomyces sp. NRRL B-3648]
MTFVQLIECRTSRLDEMNRLIDDWVEQTKGKRTATHALVGTDRSDASHVVEVVEFPSYEDAMRNSNLPETGRIFRKMLALCDEMPTFVDLDVVRDENPVVDTVRRFFEALAAPGELPPLNDLLDEDVHSHDPVNPQDTIGLDHARAEFRMWRGAFDFAFTVEDVIAQGDRACARWTWNARHTGDFLGIGPTGRRVAMTGLALFRFADNGKIADIWWQHDQLGLMQQLGALDALEQ